MNQTEIRGSYLTNDTAHNLEALETALGYTFTKLEHLRIATTHASFDHLNNYERYEFLGDSILSAIVSKYLFDKYQNELDEGRLTILRSRVVCKQNLVNIANRLNLASFILLNKGELVNNGRQRNSLLEDVVEAIIAAVYLDSNFETVTRVVLNIFRDCLDLPFDQQQHIVRDYKSFLQEITQGEWRCIPKYTLERSEGQNHNLTFYISGTIPNRRYRGFGVGKSKRAAEQLAAKELLEALQQEPFITEMHEKIKLILGTIWLSSSAVHSHHPESRLFLPSAV